MTLSDIRATFYPLLFLPARILRIVWTPLARFFSSCSLHDHFEPHPGAGFEGYYTRTQLDDGGTLAIIFCWVKNANRRANLVHVSYVPGNTRQISPFPSFKYEFFLKPFRISIRPKCFGLIQPFKIDAPDIGTMTVTSESVEYNVCSVDAELEVHLQLTDRTPWSATDPLSGPMGFLSYISHILPLNWHVHSTASTARYTITHRGRSRTGIGKSHIEKNWGTSFPSGWIWSQAFSPGDGGKSLCLAGGPALRGIHAYLIGYRSTNLHWDFRPPFALAIGPISPFMHIEHHSRTGTVYLTVHTFTRKLVLRMEAPVDSFFGLSAPLKDGHRPSFAFESFEGRIWVECWGRRWPWHSWVLIEKGFCGETFQGVPSSCAALEFGGSFSHFTEA